MGFIAEFTLSSPLMLATAKAVPEMTLEMEDLQLVGDGPARFIFWASGGDFSRLEAALVDDDTVADFTLLAAVGDRRLYRVSFIEARKHQLTYPAAAEYDIVYLDLVATAEGSHVRAQVPTRDALQAYRAACEARDVPFQLDRLYQEGSTDPGERYGLTKRQSEALRLAHERGYFGSEREATLEEIASELDISRQALAGRLRRGHERLIANTIA